MTENGRLRREAQRQQLVPLAPTGIEPLEMPPPVAQRADLPQVVLARGALRATGEVLSTERRAQGFASLGAPGANASG
jgi:hypothetical protein